MLSYFVVFIIIGLIIDKINENEKQAFTITIIISIILGCSLYTNMRIS